MVITGLLSPSGYGQHRLGHELDQLLLGDPIQSDLLFAWKMELKLLHAVPPVLLEQQSHWALSKQDPASIQSTGPERSHSISDWEI